MCEKHGDNVQETIFTTLRGAENGDEPGGITIHGRDASERVDRWATDSKKKRSQFSNNTCSIMCFLETIKAIIVLIPKSLINSASKTLNCFFHLNFPVECYFYNSDCVLGVIPFSFNTCAEAITSSSSMFTKLEMMFSFAIETESSCCGSGNIF